MDWHRVAGSLVVCIVVCGCSKSPPDATTAAPSSASAPKFDAASAPASPAPDFAEPATSEFATAEPSTLTPGAPTYGFQLGPEAVSEPLPGSPVTSLPPTPSDHAGNPLRLDFAPTPPATSENPLRSARIAPQEPAGGSAFDLPQSPASAPAGGSAMPAGAEPLASASAAPAIAALAGEPFDVVQVFYGTDRMSADPSASNWTGWLVRFIPSAVSLLATLCVGLAALARRSFVLCLIAVACLACTGSLVLQASNSTLTAIRRLGTSGPRYTTQRADGGHVDLGICEITLPRTHDPGEVEAPSITRLEVMPDATRHVVLQKTERLMESRFYEALKSRVNQSPRKELFVFVHGFNVSFDDAARRTAQIHYDLKFPGAPVFFSWPANDKFIFTYPADETNVAWSVSHLKDFLLDIVQHSEAQSINLIAHSMGNRALTAALREIDLELRGQSRLFNQVILAAPDIDADEFRQTIAPAMQRTAKQMTLYASSRDDALLASQLVHRGPRAGDAGAGLVVVNGIDTIDVTAIDTSPWGHSYYGSSDPVLNDLRELFTKAVPPRDRGWLSPAQRDGLTYWIFQATRTAAAETDVAR